MCNISLEFIKKKSFQDRSTTDYLTKFIDKYNVFANIDKLFIKKIYDIKEFLETNIPELNPLTISIPEIDYNHFDGAEELLLYIINPWIA